MNTHTTYTSKAEKYAKYRWDYAPEAVERLFSIARLSNDSIVADIGAGTGILTRHFVGRVRQVLAVEPNAQMRCEAARYLPRSPGCAILAGCAEQLPLRDGSVDLITVGQAIHWCNPEPTRQEFVRVLRAEGAPRRDGWLALLRNYGTDVEIGRALAEISTAENGVRQEKGSPPGYKRPAGFYFGGEHFQRFTFPISFEQDWEAFIGSLCSASYMPDEDHPAYHRFERAVQEVFLQYSRAGKISGHGETELIIGQII